MHTFRNISIFSPPIRAVSGWLWLTLTIFLVSSPPNGKSGNLQPWTAPEPNRPLSVMVHTSEKKVPRHNEFRCSQLFCCLLWALSQQQPWGRVSEMGVWLWDDWIASHSLALWFRVWSIKWVKIHRGTVSWQIEPHVPCKAVESTDFEAGGFSPSGKTLASRQQTYMHLRGGSLCECLLSLFELPG